jgi:uncharacterized protein YndB with AHSA1/START domain
MKRLALLLGVCMAGPAAADLTGVSAGHFESSHRAEVAATPAQVYEVLAQLPRWWNPQHSWSGDTRNMSLELSAGGCWCERWQTSAGEGASARHATVLQVLPGRALVLEASLGPLLSLPARGVLTLATASTGGKTTVRLSYRVSGAPELALDKLAPAVDDVLGQQFARLRAMIESARP